MLSTGKKYISVVPLVPLLSAFSITNGQKPSFKLQFVGLLSCRGKYLEVYKSSLPTLDRLRRLKRVLAGSINVSGCVCDWWCWANAPQIFPRLVGLVLSCLIHLLFGLMGWGVVGATSPHFAVAHVVILVDVNDSCLCHQQIAVRCVIGW